MTELDKLEKYLKDNNIPYQRIDKRPGLTSRQWLELYGAGKDFHQICVPSRTNCEFDVICHQGSYGYEEGLLEIMGLLTEEEMEEDRVLGYLSAEDVIKRINTMSAYARGEE